MLIRMLSIAAALTLAACATDLDPLTSTDESGLRCYPFCDPEETTYEPALNAAYQRGFAGFPDGIPTDVGCIDDDPMWICSVSFITTANPCGPVVVQCSDLPFHGRHRVHCDTTVVDQCR